MTALVGSPVYVPGAGILQSTISEVNKLLSTAGTITAQLPALLPPIIDTDMSDGMAVYPGTEELCTALGGWLQA